MKENLGLKAAGWSKAMVVKSTNEVSLIVLGKTEIHVLLSGDPTVDLLSGR